MMSFPVSAFSFVYSCYVLSSDKNSLTIALVQEISVA